jgi:hypothetical protein
MKPGAYAASSTYRMYHARAAMVTGMTHRRYRLRRS